MRKDSYFSEAGIFLAGAIAAGLLLARRPKQPDDAPASADAPPPNVATHEAPELAALAMRLANIEERLDRHDVRLAEVPSTPQIVAAMEQVIFKMVNSLEDRFKTQAHSIEVLKGGMVQTDGLLERMIESLDALQSSEPLDLTGGGLLEHPAG